MGTIDPAGRIRGEPRTEPDCDEFPLALELALIIPLVLDITDWPLDSDTTGASISMSVFSG